MNRLSYSLMCLLATALLTVGCKNEDSSISREDRCSFTFSYEDHRTSTLFVAVQNPGCYVFVSTKGDGKNTVRHVYVVSNEEGAEVEDNIIRTAPENNLEYRLGANNEIGLIVGCTNFNGLCGYDRTCPNCTVLRALQWTGNRQKVTCKECKRTYDLETAAVIEGAGGSPLKRYYCAFNGIAVRVWN